MRGRKKAAMEPSTSRGSSRDEPTANTCNFFQLPNPIIFDILSKLPIKDLLHCSCVCKRFLCFISDPEFACLHLSRSPISILIKSRPLKNNSKRLQVAQLDANGASFQVSKLKFTPKFSVPFCDIYRMSSCNGLLCLIRGGKDDSFYVCNPILGEFITIPPPYKDRRRSDFWGLGYSTATNQYKLLQSYYLIFDYEPVNRRVMAEIYTIGTGTWRTIGNAPSHCVSAPFNAFLNGAAHWCNNSPDGDEFIHYFDFDTEQFGTVPTPDHFEKANEVYADYPQFGVLGGCLFVIEFPNLYHIDIWVMKEYGVKESWTKQFVIENFYDMDDKWDYYQPMIVLSNGEILMLLNDEAIVCYNQRRKQFRETRITRSEFNAIAYTPCFVSLYNVAKGEQISRIQGTRVYDKICIEELRDCASCGAQPINSG